MTPAGVSHMMSIANHLIIVSVCSVLLASLAADAGEEMSREPRPGEKIEPTMIGDEKIKQLLVGNKLLVAGKFEEVYRDWCHPHIQEQIDKNEFVESMKKDFGKSVIKLFADVIKAIDDKSGPEVIVAQPQEDKDEYEFVLTKVKENNPIGRKGSPWHIELKLHDGKWKLMDTD